MNGQDERRVREVTERLAASTGGEWHWSRSYGQRVDVGEEGLHHWCLESTKSPPGRCIDGQLVTVCTTESEWTGDTADTARRICERPDWQLIANAPGDLAFLLGLVEFQGNLIHDLRSESAAQDALAEAEEALRSALEDNAALNAQVDHLQGALSEALREDADWHDAFDTEEDEDGTGDELVYGEDVP